MEKPIGIYIKAVPKPFGLNTAPDLKDAIDLLVPLDNIAYFTPKNNNIYAISFAEQYQSAFKDYQYCVAILLPNEFTLLGQQQI